MDDGEVFVTIIAIGVTLAVWPRWLYRATVTFAPTASPALRGIVMTTPLALVVALIAGLHRFAPPEVKDSPSYLTLFTAVGAVTYYIITVILRFIGLDVLAGGIESGNRGVAFSAIGAWLGGMVLNVGANIGNGDTIATTLLPLAIGMLLLTAFMIAVAWCVRLPEVITGTRSLSAGWRCGALTLSAAIVLARASAGDWVSLARTVADLARTVPALILLVALGWMVERTYPSPRAGGAVATIAGGIAPALAFTCCGVLFARIPWP